MRVAHGELCFALPEFKALSHAQLCRRLGLGDSWVDTEQDQLAEDALNHAQNTRRESEKLASHP